MNRKKVIATWSVSLDTKCPECGEYVDLLDDPDFWDGRKLEIGENGTKNSENVEVICPKCEAYFNVECEY